MERSILQAEKNSLSSIYLDNGYVFFQLTIDTVKSNTGTVNLTFNIHEGIQAKIGQIIIKGNKTVPQKDILDKIVFQSGDLFSRSKLYQSVKAIMDMGKFVSGERIPDVRPVQDPSDLTPDYAVVDIVFELTEK